MFLKIILALSFAALALAAPSPQPPKLPPFPALPPLPALPPFPIPPKLPALPIVLPGASVNELLDNTGDTVDQTFSGPSDQ
ncbi:hypothetical protein BGW80DRAFT_1564928 [Lactifluus volemus]|nr:hypothetical protein BGW80DRAFT_1564928 [Lactifluus volemus]